MTKIQLTFYNRKHKVRNNIICTNLEELFDALEEYGFENLERMAIRHKDGSYQSTSPSRSRFDDDESE